MSKSSDALALIYSGDTYEKLQDLKEKIAAGNATSDDVEQVKEALNGELSNLSNILNGEAGNDLNEPKARRDPNTVTADDPSVSPKGDVHDENAPGRVTDPETGKEPSTPLGNDDKEESKSVSRRKSAQSKADSK